MAKEYNIVIFCCFALYKDKLEGRSYQSMRFLETKWGDIKAIVVKFNGCYWTMKDFDES